MSETFDQKTARNVRVQARYDELMHDHKHGHYETMFRVVQEEVERAVTPLQRDLATFGQDTEATENRIIDAEIKTQEASVDLDRLREAARPFAEHDWMDAELEDDSCQLTRHSGKVTVGHWRALRAALSTTRRPSE